MIVSINRLNTKQRAGGHARHGCEAQKAGSPGMLKMFGFRVEG